MEHGFWLILFVVTIIWYAAVTVIVAVKGQKDIKTMIDREK